MKKYFLATALIVIANHPCLAESENPGGAYGEATGASILIITFKQRNPSSENHLAEESLGEMPGAAIGELVSQTVN